MMRILFINIILNLYVKYYKWKSQVNEQNNQNKMEIKYMGRIGWEKKKTGKKNSTREQHSIKCIALRPRWRQRLRSNILKYFVKSTIWFFSYTLRCFVYIVSFKCNSMYDERFMLGIVKRKILCTIEKRFRQ